MNAVDIKVGDKVRSFDFDNRDLTGDRAAYVTGTVVDILEPGETFYRTGAAFADCSRYVIRVVSRTRRGAAKHIADREYVYPPVNGTPTWIGRVTDGVVRVLDLTAGIIR
jgi:hypothetical protein